MKINNPRFVGSAAGKNQYIADNLPEIAIVGRSNVGKSSLINMMLGRKNLVKTSQTPGKTQLINFFDIDGLFRIVDLPGYGFANVSRAVKRSWGDLIGEYLANRPNLLEIMMLVDIRRSPNEDDLHMIDWIRASGYRGIYIATKADKLGRSKQSEQRREIIKKLGIDRLIVTSAESRLGKYEIWDALNSLFKERDIDIFIERQEG